MFARFKVNCEVLPLRSFPNFKLVISLIGRSYVGP